MRSAGGRLHLYSLRADAYLAMLRPGRSGFASQSPRTRIRTSTLIALKPSRQVIFLPSAYVRP